VWGRLRPADEQPAAWQILYPGQGQVVDVDQQPGPQHVLAHQAHLVVPPARNALPCRASTIAIAVSASATRA
jgi:hypothetical protein